MSERIGHRPGSAPGTETATRPDVGAAPHFLTDVRNFTDMSWETLADVAHHLTIQDMSRAGRAFAATIAQVRDQPNAGAALIAGLSAAISQLTTRPDYSALAEAYLAQMTELSQHSDSDSVDTQHLRTILEKYTSCLAIGIANATLEYHIADTADDKRVWQEKATHFADKIYANSPASEVAVFGLLASYSAVDLDVAKWRHQVDDNKVLIAGFEFPAVPLPGEGFEPAKPPTPTELTTIDRARTNTAELETLIAQTEAHLLAQIDIARAQDDFTRLSHRGVARHLMNDPNRAFMEYEQARSVFQTRRDANSPVRENELQDEVVVLNHMSSLATPAQSVQYLDEATGLIDWIGITHPDHAKMMMIENKELRLPLRIQGHEAQFELGKLTPDQFNKTVVDEYNEVARYCAGLKASKPQVQQIIHDHLLTNLAAALEHELGFVGSDPDETTGRQESAIYNFERAKFKYHLTASEHGWHEASGRAAWAIATHSFHQGKIETAIRYLYEIRTDHPDSTAAAILRTPQKDLWVREFGILTEDGQFSPKLGNPDFTAALKTAGGRTFDNKASAMKGVLAGAGVGIGVATADFLAGTHVIGAGGLVASAGQLIFGGAIAGLTIERAHQLTTSWDDISASYKLGVTHVRGKDLARNAASFGIEIGSMFAGGFAGQLAKQGITRMGSKWLANWLLSRGIVYSDIALAREFILVREAAFVGEGIVFHPVAGLGRVSTSSALGLPTHPIGFAPKDFFSSWLNLRVLGMVGGWNPGPIAAAGERFADRATRALINSSISQSILTPAQAALSGDFSNLGLQYFNGLYDLISITVGQHTARASVHQVQALAGAIRKLGPRLVTHTKTILQNIRSEALKYRQAPGPLLMVMPTRSDAMAIFPDAKTQQRVQTAATDMLSFTRLGNSDNSTPPSGVIWINSAGLLLNPTLTSLRQLRLSGVNPNEVSDIILTRIDEDVIEGLVEIILRRERIQVIADPQLFRAATLRASALLNNEFDVSRWVDNVPTGSGVVALQNGKKIEVAKGDGNLQVTFRRHAVSEKDLGDLEPLHSRRLIKRAIAKTPKALSHYLKTISLFSHLDTKDILDVAREGQYVEFAPGAEIVRKGDEADSCYVLLSGIADVVEANGKTVWSFYSRDFFGEVGLQSEGTRSANVNARTSVRALKISRDLYNRIIYNPLRGSPKFNATKYALEAFFTTMAPNIHLSEDSIDAIALRTSQQAYVDEVKEGDIGDAAYIVMSGEVEIFKSGRPYPIATRGKNSIFGEMALLTPQARRTATVRVKAGTTARVLKIDRELFEFILYKYPGLDHGIRSTINARRRENRETLFQPHMVRIPEYLSGEGIPARNENVVYGQWRGFCKLFGIDFQAHDITLGELTAFAPNVDVLHRMLRNILGDAVLLQGVVAKVRFKSGGESQTASYDSDSRKLTVGSGLLATDPATFAKHVISIVGRIAAEHIFQSELLPEEKAGIERAQQTFEVRSPADQRPDGETSARQFLGRFLAAYIVNGDGLRNQINSIRTPPHVKAALETLYQICHRLHFMGVEFTREASAKTLNSVPGKGVFANDGKAFDSAAAASKIEVALNSVFKRYALFDRSSLYRRIYEPEVFNELKLDLLRRLTRQFQSVHVQKFTDDLVEVSIYDPASSTRTVVAFDRTQEGTFFAWKARKISEHTHTASGRPPISTVLVNLKNEQFGGVKGTPENILTIQAYLQAHRRDEASVSIYDCQWPENSVDAFVEELKINPPDVIGVSATFGTLGELERLMEKISHLKNKPIVVVGGLQSTWNFDYILSKHPDVLVVRYEGEEAMAKIVDMVAKMPVDNRRRFIQHNVSELRQIPNIAFSQAGRIQTHPRKAVDLTMVPAPDRQTNAAREKKAGWLENAEGRGRGCGYGACIFCTRTHGSFRFFPMERGLADFQSYMEAEVPFVVYVDEDFLPDNDPNVAKAFAQSIIDLKERHRAAFLAKHGREPVLPSFYIAARARAIYRAEDPEGNVQRLEALRALKRAGLVKIFLGAESGAEVQFHKTYHKGGTIAEVEKAMDVIRDEGVQVVAGFITFDPVMTMLHLKQDLDFMVRNRLVDVDPLTEPLNPFKFYRAQVGSALADRLRRIGLIASSMDPNLLSFDSAYRNPLIRLITHVGTTWKAQSAQLDYSLKGIIWYAEQSVVETERAARFIELFNQLKQADFELIEAIQNEIAGTQVNEARGVAQFLAGLKDHPDEKVVFEVKRVLFPHEDIANSISDYMRKNANRPDFNRSAFLSDVFAGRFPDGFTFGKSTPHQYRDWLKDIRTDVAQLMLPPADLGTLTARADRLLRVATGKRRQILEDFAASPWQDYYKTNPEAVRRGKDFEAELKKAIEEHKAAEANEAPQVVPQNLDMPRFSTQWAVSLDEFLDYRHPNLGDSIPTVIAVLEKLAATPHSAVGGLKDVRIDENGAISFTGNVAAADPLKVATSAVLKIYLNGLDPFSTQWGTSAPARGIYLAAKSGEYTDLTHLISDLKTLYRLASRPVTITAGETALRAVPVTLDGTTEIIVGGDERMPIIVRPGAHAAARIELPDLTLPKITTLPELTLPKMTALWKSTLSGTSKLSPQEKFNIINSMVTLLSHTITTDTQWIEELANDVDASVAPMTMVLPDEPAYHGWQTDTPGARVVYLHPLIYDKVWPGIRPHLAKIRLLAKPEVFDDYEKMLSLVQRGEVTPSFVNFIYEVFFNRLSPKAFLRNAKPQDTAQRFTALGMRIMPRRAPVLWLPKDDPRVEYFAPVADGVDQLMHTPDGRLRFVVHPQVYQEWKASGQVPFETMDTGWTLTFPTASARTLYVMDADKDFIAKAHSKIWVGPAVRHLTRGNVEHSHNISAQIAAVIDSGELPASIRNLFAFIDDGGGVVVNDPAFYPAKGSVGTIFRSTRAYPESDTNDRVLIPGFALHNNAISVEDNQSPDVLAGLINHNIALTGQSPEVFFTNSMVRPFYKIFFYFMFKQGLLLEPHGQNFFFEVDKYGKITRLVFKDWQTTMVDMETRLRRALPDGAIKKHFLGVEAGMPLSVSLVFDYFFSTYLFQHVVDSYVRSYRGTQPVQEFKADLIAKLKRTFDEEISIYQGMQDKLPDGMVRHGKKPMSDQTNDVPYMIEGPPPFRPTTFERAIDRVVDERYYRGIIPVQGKSVADLGVQQSPDAFSLPDTIDLERSRLQVKANGVWTDVREIDQDSKKIDGAYYLILPEGYDPTKTYPLLMLMHGTNSTGGDVITWADKIKRNDIITVVPFAPYVNKRGEHSWFEGKRNDQKAASIAFLREVAGDLKNQLKIDRVIAGGISQGGYMTLHAMVEASDLFDAAFTINAPFAPEYLGDITPPAGNNHGKPITIFHLENDPVVPVHHSQRAEDYFRSRGYDVERRVYNSGQHKALSAATAMDIDEMLDQMFGTGGAPQSPIQTIGKHHIPGHEGSLYETVLDTTQALGSRVEAFTALEQLQFKPIFDMWEDTSSLSRFRDAKSQLATIERTLFFLTAHLAYLGKDQITDEEARLFTILTSAYPMAAYQHVRFSASNEPTVGHKALMNLIDKIDYLHDVALMLQESVIKRLARGPL